VIQRIHCSTGDVPVGTCFSYLSRSLSLSSVKNCDIKQAFVQSSLPEDEVYIVKPPIGFPKSSPGTYWKLLWSLYGLRRAPRLWYDKISSHLRNMGLRQAENSPCLFVGNLLEGHPLIYNGIYVDDIIFFSSRDLVERRFEQQLSNIGEVDFMGQVTHFLGIEFSWSSHLDGHLSVTLTQQSFTESLLDSWVYIIMLGSHIFLLLIVRVIP
jgi:hypothetical protein